MFELRGKYNQATIYTDNVDNATKSQVIELLNQEFVKDAKIRIMPDCHAGAGCVIGTTMTIGDKIVPNLVGVDIGCGMEVISFKLKTDIEKEGKRLDGEIRRLIPSGFKVRNTPHPYIEATKINDLICKPFVDIERGRLSLGTLGGGNHFIEIDQDYLGKQYLVVHSGSRNLGLQVATYYQKMAIESLELSSIPPHLRYLDGHRLEMYLHDMKIMQDFAVWNRKAIVDDITEIFNTSMRQQFTSIHNFIDIENRILRKGATSARTGELLIIPLNMRDGSLICVGKGNSDWNYSAPHGAGRMMSRGQAKKEIKLEDFQKSMVGIFTTSVSQSTIDESPMAYKPMNEIIDNISDTVEITNVIKPVYNLKAGG